MGLGWMEAGWPRSSAPAAAAGGGGAAPATLDDGDLAVELHGGERKLARGQFASPKSL